MQVRFLLSQLKINKMLHPVTKKEIKGLREQISSEYKFNYNTFTKEDLEKALKSIYIDLSEDLHPVTKMPLPKKDFVMCTGRQGIKNLIKQWKRINQKVEKKVVN